MPADLASRLREAGAGIDPRLEAAFTEANRFSLAGHCHLLVMVGSESHGTEIPASEKDGIDDSDLMALVIPPAHRVLGVDEWEHWRWQFEELDVTVYSLRKGVRLLLKGNPNVLAMLWAERRFYRHLTATGEALIFYRDIFSSRESYHAFVGYAHGQLKRMTAFDESRMAEYDYLTGYVTGDLGLAVEVVLDADANKLAYLAGRDQATLSRLQSFRSLHRNYFSGYMGHKRKTIVRQHGYDTKNASHLIRLLRMGIEFLRDGKLRVWREDAEELRAIKRGAWTLEQVQAEADRLFAVAREVRDQSPLPTQPNRGYADHWLTVKTLEALRPRAPLPPEDRADG